MTGAQNIAEWRDNPRKRAGQKYHNVKTSIGAEKFDSRAEAKRWGDLVLLQQAGHVADLARQVSFELIPKQRRPSGGIERACSYVADFTYREAGKLIIEDVKGAVTPEYRLKRKLMLHVHGVEIREIKA